MQVVHDKLSNHQQNSRTQDTQKTPLVRVGDKVWRCSKRTSKHKDSMIFPKYIGPILTLQVNDNHTYPVERNGRVSRESGSKLKEYFDSLWDAVKP